VIGPGGCSSEVVALVVDGTVVASDEAVVEDPGDSAGFAGELQAASNTPDAANKSRVQSFRERVLCLLTLDVVLARSSELLSKGRRARISSWL
jgi:hypothetical protein